MCKLRKHNFKVLTIIKRNFNIRILHNNELGTLCVQRHLRRLCANVAYKQRSVTVLPPVSPWQCIQSKMLQVNRAQRRWRGRLQSQNATSAIVRLIYLDLQTHCTYYVTDDTMVQDNNAKLQKYAVILTCRFMPAVHPHPQSPSQTPDLQCTKG